MNISLIKNENILTINKIALNERPIPTLNYCILVAVIHIKLRAIRDLL